MDKHIKASPDEICQQRKKRGFPAKPNAAAIHRAQALRRYYEQYFTPEEVEKRRRRQEAKEWKQVLKLHEKEKAEEERAQKQA